MVLNKHEIEAALHAENQAIKSGHLKEDNPVDVSDGFQIFCNACRRGDLKVCQEKIQEGVNINARDRFDYTPLILEHIADRVTNKASLCGHFEVVQLLLESGALCERDTFQGERALYNALNDRIRDLLLSYDYSKSRDPLQPLAAHVTSLLSREVPQTSDITIVTDTQSFHLHKFILSARSPYFAKRLAAAPDTTTWRVPPSVPTRSLQIAISALYFGEVNLDLTASEEDQATLAGIEKLGRQLEIGVLLETILESDRRVARQKRTEEVERGRNQLKSWFESSIMSNQVHTDSEKADKVQWDLSNSIFADVLLCATEDDASWEHSTAPSSTEPSASNGSDTPSGQRLNGIPIGPLAMSGSVSASRAASPTRSKRRSATLIPAHRAMLLRSEYFSAMFSSSFKEAQPSAHLPIVHIDCSPAVLTVILTYLYTEDTAGITLDLAIDVLFAADLLFIEKLKVRAAMIISTLGNGGASIVESENPRGETDVEDVVDIYDVVRAGWDTRVHRLEEFGARYIAQRLERYIDETDFRELVKESAERIQARQETDTVELIDDWANFARSASNLNANIIGVADENLLLSIRYYLSERFRLRFEDTGFEDMVEVEGTAQPETDTNVDDNNKEPSDQLAPLGVGAQPTYTGYNISGQTDGVVRTLDGDIAGDEFAQDSINYQILLGKIDALLDSLKLDA